MPQLNMHQRVVNTVDYINLQNFIKDVYEQEVDIISMEEARTNDGLNFFASNTLISKYEEEVFNSWKDQGGFLAFGTAMLLNFLVRDGYISSGYYLILC